MCSLLEDKFLVIAHHSFIAKYPNSIASWCALEECVACIQAGDLGELRFCLLETSRLPHRSDLVADDVIEFQAVLDVGGE